MPNRVIPAEWMPPAHMRRVILHWTAGARTASNVDREHYHFMIEAGGRVVRGDSAVPENETTRNGRYAAHTRGCNTGSIGIALCGMLNATQQPFHAGPEPFDAIQWAAFAAATADLCEAYSIPVTPQTVLGHGEVQATLGIPQNGKWDPLVLPYAPERSPAVVMNAFRAAVGELIRTGGAGYGAKEAAPVTIIIDGHRLDTPGYLDGDTSFAPLREACDVLRARILDVTRDNARLLRNDGLTFTIPTQQRGDHRFSRVRDIAAFVGRTPIWDPHSRTVTL